jgi:hypothetical protein
MLKLLWPHKADRPLPSSSFMWEGTRICIEKELPAELRNRVKWELVLGYLELSADAVPRSAKIGVQRFTPDRARGWVRSPQPSHRG